MQDHLQGSSWCMVKASSQHRFKESAMLSSTGLWRGQQELLIAPDGQLSDSTLMAA